tara:strand:+ start:2389 stop:2571 length:183 start_codon:yes stop_codon:yes gene_type:complete
MVRFETALLLALFVKKLKDINLLNPYDSDRVREIDFIIICRVRKFFVFSKQKVFLATIGF